MNSNYKLESRGSKNRETKIILNAWMTKSMIEIGLKEEDVMDRDLWRQKIAIWKIP